MFLFRLPCLLVLVGSIAPEAAPVAQQDDPQRRPDGSDDSQDAGWKSFLPTPREAVIGLGSGIVGGGIGALVVKNKQGGTSGGTIAPAGPPGTIHFQPPSPEKLRPGPMQPPALYGSKTWVRVLTHYLYQPEDKDGKCIEDCIQTALRHASENRLMLNMVEQYETCRGTGPGNCYIDERYSKYKSYEVLYELAMLRGEAERKEEEMAAALAKKAQERTRRENMGRSEFSLAEIPKAVQGRVKGAVQGTDWSRMASEFGAAVSSQAGKVPKAFTPSFSPASMGGQGFRMPRPVG